MITLYATRLHAIATHDMFSYWVMLSLSCHGELVEPHCGVGLCARPSTSSG
jgi:hypothetical protein